MPNKASNMISYMCLIVTIDLSATVLEILTSEVSKKWLYFIYCWGPDGPNDLKLISGVKRYVFYHIYQKIQFVKQKNFLFFCGLDFDFQGHLRSKVMMSNESLIIISYLTLIVTKCLTCSVSDIWSFEVFCFISLIGLINFIRSWSKIIGLYSSGR